MVLQSGRTGLYRGASQLGWAYQKGEGVPQDDAEAVKWYRKAAEQGSAWSKKQLQKWEQDKIK